MNEIGKIAAIFLAVRSQIKIFHWQTKSYAKHIASDSFITDFDKLTDQFIEVLQGSRNKRLHIQSSFKYVNYNSDKAINILHLFRKFLRRDLVKILRKDDTELLNIRDELISLTNQTLYLFTLT